MVAELFRTLDERRYATCGSSGDRAVVQAVVNGVEGRILLVREARRLRVLRVGPRQRRGR